MKLPFCVCRSAYKFRWRYLIPRRLTIEYNPPIFRWLWWVFGPNGA